MQTKKKELNLDLPLKDLRTAVVLAGGVSQRMGQDKALICDPDGRTWIEKIVKLAHTWAPRVWVVTGPSLKYQDPLKDKNVELICDDVPNLGPLGGIATALTKTMSSHVLFLSCDMPDVSVEDLNKLPFISNLEEVVWSYPTYFPFVIKVNGSVLMKLKQRLEENEKSLGKFLKLLTGRSICFKNMERTLNLNSSQDLALRHEN